METHSIDGVSHTRWSGNEARWGLEFGGKADEESGVDSDAWGHQSWLESKAIRASPI